MRCDAEEERGGTDRYRNASHSLPSPHLLLFPALTVLTDMSYTYLANGECAYAIMRASILRLRDLYYPLYEIYPSGTLCCVRGERGGRRVRAGWGWGDFFVRAYLLSKFVHGAPFLFPFSFL